LFEKIIGQEKRTGEQGRRKVQIMVSRVQMGADRSKKSDRDTLRKGMRGDNKPGLAWSLHTLPERCLWQYRGHCH